MRHSRPRAGCMAIVIARTTRTHTLGYSPTLPGAVWPRRLMLTGRKLLPHVYHWQDWKKFV